MQDAADPEEQRPTGANEIAPVGARSAFVAWTLTFVFLALGYVLLGAFMLIASVILSLIDLVNGVQTVNPRKQATECRVSEEKHRQTARKQKSEAPPAA